MLGMLCFCLSGLWSSALQSGKPPNIFNVFLNHIKRTPLSPRLTKLPG